MATTEQDTGQAQVVSLRKARRFNRFDYPWLNTQLIAGALLVGGVLLIGLVGPYFWDTTLSRATYSPLNLPPMWQEGGDPAHPLGTENMGRDMLALIISGAPATLQIGIVSGAVGMGLGIIFGFVAGFMGGWIDDVIRTASDIAITVPSLLILIVISSYVEEVTLVTMALIVSLFAWARPTRFVRAQVLSMREQGYVLVAKLSGASTFDIMFKEMMPNLIPYLFASFIGNVAGGILAAVSLEVLGLGPQRIPTLGMTIYYSLQAAAILRGMWWWWGFPALVLIMLFVGLFLINIGMDEICNPRLRKARE
jgi:peptide/nickel transport system permease protein